MDKELLNKVLDNMIIGDCWTGTKDNPQEVGSCLKHIENETLYIFKDNHSNNFRIVKTGGASYSSLPLTKNDMTNLIEFIYETIKETKEES